MARVRRCRLSIVACSLEKARLGYSVDSAAHTVRAHPRSWTPWQAPASPPQDRSLWMLAVLSLLMAFASISTDLYLPAMPAMQATLGASAGCARMDHLGLSGRLQPGAAGCGGPIGDRIGRRLPIALGLLLPFIGGSGRLCAGRQCPGLIAWRAVQAAGACASVVLARAMVRDLYEGERAARDDVHADDGDGDRAAGGAERRRPDPEAVVVARDFLDAGDRGVGHAGGGRHAARDPAGPPPQRCAAASHARALRRAAPASAVAEATSASAASFMAGCTPMSPERRSRTSITTTSRPSTYGLLFGLGDRGHHGHQPAQRDTSSGVSAATA